MRLDPLASATDQIALSPKSPGKPHGLPLTRKQKRGTFVPIMTTAVEQLRIRVPAARARKARAILNDLGTDAGSVVNMLFAQIVKQRAIPFRVADTDPETEEIRRDPEAVAAINAHKAGKITRWYTMEDAFGE